MAESKKELSKAQKREVERPQGVENLSDTPVFTPKADILETDTDVTVMLDLPGADEESVDVSLEKNVLTIRGRVPQPVLEGYDLVYSEYAVGNYERAFTLSEEIDRNQIQATVKNGVLRLVLPKAKEAQTKKIPIKTG